MPVNDRRQHIADLNAAKDLLYEKLEADHDRIGKLYKKNPSAAEIEEDFWLADLRLYELTVDELRELTA